MSDIVHWLRTIEVFSPGTQYVADKCNEAADEIERLRAALIRARGFVQNGIALGYIRMPDPDVPDTAHELPSIIDAALGIRTQ